MNNLVAIIIFCVVLYFLFYKSQTEEKTPMTVCGYDKSNFDGVDPVILQNTITQIQQQQNNLYPVSTVYFNKSSDGGYSGRFVFMDSSNYAGVQYDATVSQDGTLISANKGVPASFQNPFTGFVNKFKFGNLNTVDPTPDMSAVWNNYVVTA